MNLKAMIYHINNEEYDPELLDSLNTEECRVFKNKPAVINYIKNFIKSTDTWKNVTSLTEDVAAKADEDTITVSIKFPKFKKPISFNAIVVFEEVKGGFKPLNVQIFDDVNITADGIVSAVTITINTQLED